MKRERQFKLFAICLFLASCGDAATQAEVPSTTIPPTTIPPILTDKDIALEWNKNQWGQQWQ